MSCYLDVLVLVLVLGCTGSYMIAHHHAALSVVYAPQLEKGKTSDFASFRIQP